MSGNSDQKLHTLYLELGELQANRGRRGEAADAYALALYYARRLNNPALVNFCRELVSDCHPTHVATRSQFAPLFFAQLLMRYPAEDAEQLVHQLKMRSASMPSAAEVYRLAGELPESPRTVPEHVSFGEFTSSDAPPVDDWFAAQNPYRTDTNPTHPRTSPIEPISANAKLATADAPRPLFSFPKPPASAPESTQPHPSQVAPRYLGTMPPEFEQHHVLDLGTASPGDPFGRSRVVDDLLLQVPADEPLEIDDSEASWGSAVVHAAGILTVIAGSLFIGYFTQNLYQNLTPTQVDHILQIVRQFTHSTPRETEVVIDTVPTLATPAAPSTIQIETDAGSMPDTTPVLHPIQVVPVSSEPWNSRLRVGENDTPGKAPR